MATRPKPACITSTPDDAAVLASILFGSEDEKKTDARKEVSKITVLWQHWSPRLKSAVRADIASLIPAGADVTPAVTSGYSEGLSRIALRDLGRG